MCSVQIYTFDRQLINEIHFRTVTAGIQYADQLAAENPHRIYDVMDDGRQKVYSR